MTLLAIKRKLWHWLKGLGLLLLWRSLGLVLVILFFVGIGLAWLKYNYVTPPNGLIFSTFEKYVQDWTYRFLYTHPYLWNVWKLIPVYDDKNPITLLTNGWVLWMGLPFLARPMLHRKVEPDIMQSPLIIHGNIGVMNSGTMTIRQIQSIAGHLTRISSPAQRQVADAIASLTKAVAEEQTLDNSKRSEVLDQLGELARQTALPEADRSKGVASAVVKALDTALTTAGRLAGVWNAFGGTIKEFFGIQ
jgi:hypothetical protein